MSGSQFFVCRGPRKQSFVFKSSSFLDTQTLRIEFTFRFSFWNSIICLKKIISPSTPTCYMDCKRVIASVKIANRFPMSFVHPSLFITVFILNNHPWFNIHINHVLTTSGFLSTKEILHNQVPYAQYYQKNQTNQH